jgi:hypothetical protein
VASPSDAPTNGAEPKTLPFVRITFHPDGQMELHTEGVGPPQLWAAARLVELWGDSEFTVQQIAASGQGTDSPLVVPGGKGRNGFGMLRGGRKS